MAPKLRAFFLWRSLNLKYISGKFGRIRENSCAPSKLCLLLHLCMSLHKLFRKISVIYLQGRRQRGGQWFPAPPFEICAPISRLAPWLLHTSNTVFLKCGPPSGFWPLLSFGPPCCYILATGLSTYALRTDSI